MTGRIRPAVKRRLVEICTAVLTELQVGFDDTGEPIRITVRVAYTWDGQPVSRSTLWLGPVEGNTEPDSIGIERLERDEFVIPFHLQLLGFASAEAAEERTMTVVNAVSDALSRAHRLRGLDVPDTDPDSYRGIATAAFGQMDGPGHSFPGPGSGQSIEGWCSWDLHCSTHLDPA